MHPTRAEVLDWVQGSLGVTLSPADQTDVLHGSGHDGTAAEALLSGFAERFAVDMAGCQPRMHSRSAAQGLRPDWPFPTSPPHAVFVPLSISLLHAAAVAGRWPVCYPILPDVRDLSVVNLPLLMLGLIAATLLVLWVVPVVF